MTTPATGPGQPGEDPVPDRHMSHRDKVEFMIERDGWGMDAIPPRLDNDPPVPGYGYTVGFGDLFGFPEVCLFGLAPAACRGLLGLVADALAGGTELPVGAVFIGLLDGGQPCAFLPIPPEKTEDLFPALVEMGLGAAPVVQLAWPDPAGTLPWEDGFAPHIAVLQPLLGDLST